MTVQTVNFNVQTDDMIAAYLLSLPMSSTLYGVLFDQNAASVSPIDIYQNLTRSTSQTLTFGSLLVSNRAIDLGAFVCTGTVELPRSIGIITDLPANTPDLVVVQNIFANGAAWDFSVNGDLYVDDFQIYYHFDGET